jgi:hypothetical protein
MLDGGSAPADYSEGTITNGSGKASGVVVTVQQGTSADINVDFYVTSVSIESFQQWWNEASSYFDDEQRSTLQENWGGGGFLGGFLGGGFGILFGAGDAYHYRHQSDSHWGATSSQQEGFAKSVYNLTQTLFHVTGTLHATGISYIPVSCSAFVNLTTITFADGKTLTAIDTDNPVAADVRTGDTSGVQSSPTKLNLVKADQPAQSLATV